VALVSAVMRVVFPTPTSGLIMAAAGPAAKEHPAIAAAPAVVRVRN
jgi:hypothetical protein